MKRETLSDTVLLRLTKALHAHVAKEASLEGVSTSEWIRQALSASVRYSMMLRAETSDRHSGCD
jgi:predicted HicB family RNase H-like nuclease